MARAADPNRPLTDAVALAATRDRRRMDMSRSVVCGSPGYELLRLPFARPDEHC